MMAVMTLQSEMNIYIFFRDRELEGKRKWLKIF